MLPLSIRRQKKVSSPYVRVHMPLLVCHPPHPQTHNICRCSYYNMIEYKPKPMNLRIWGPEARMPLWFGLTYTISKSPIPRVCLSTLELWPHTSAYISTFEYLWKWSIIPHLNKFSDFIMGWKGENQSMKKTQAEKGSSYVKIGGALPPLIQRSNNPYPIVWHNSLFTTN